MFLYFHLVYRRVIFKWTSHPQSSSRKHKDDDGKPRKGYPPLPQPRGYVYPEAEGSSEQAFSYKPLSTTKQQIRLCKVESRSKDEVRCTLRHFDFHPSSCPEYVALSYTWGDATPIQHIHLNGSLFEVRQNLWNFLSMGFQPLYEWVWVDHICIDQEHILERNAQVDLMADLYSRAEEVIVWLGEGGENTLPALRYLHDTVPPPEYGPLPFDGGDSEQAKQHRHRPPRKDELAGLSDLFSRRYWSRLWVTQELVRARNVVLCCADAVADLRNWDKFMVQQQPWLASKLRMSDEGIEMQGIDRLSEPGHSSDNKDAQQDGNDGGDGDGHIADPTSGAASNANGENARKSTELIDGIEEQDFGHDLKAPGDTNGQTTANSTKATVDVTEEDDKEVLIAIGSTNAKPSAQDSRAVNGLDKQDDETASSMAHNANEQDVGRVTELVDRTGNQTSEPMVHASDEPGKHQSVQASKAADGLEYLALCRLYANQHTRTGNLNPLGPTLSRFSHGDCDDLRDKVFGLQGMVRVDQRVKIDYSKTLPEVYVEAAMALAALSRWNEASDGSCHELRNLRVAVGVDKEVIGYFETRLGLFEDTPEDVGDKAGEDVSQGGEDKTVEDISENGEDKTAESALEKSEEQITENVSEEGGHKTAEETVTWTWNERPGDADLDAQWHRIVKALPWGEKLGTLTRVTTQLSASGGHSR